MSGSFSTKLVKVFKTSLDLDAPNTIYFLVLGYSSFKDLMNFSRAASLCPTSKIISFGTFLTLKSSFKA